MKSKNVVFIITVLIIAVFFFTGCGGGGGGASHDTDTPDNNQEQQQNNNNDTDNNPDDDSKVYAPYEPYPFTEEQLINLARYAVPAGSFDISLLEEDEDYDEFITDASYNPYDVKAAELTDEQKTRRAKKIVSAMWKHAVKLAVFPNSVDVPYRQEGQTIRLNQTATSHGSRAKSATQKRFLYVYPSFNGRTILETFPYKQYTENNTIYTWKLNGCTDEIMGTDCVGFVYHCVYAATKNYDAKVDNKILKGARMRFYPDSKRLGNPANWINTGLFPHAKVITDKKQPPKPGDILIWDGHVGMAVRIDYNTIGVAHSTGRTSGPYSCEEYARNGSKDIEWLGYPSDKKSLTDEEGVNGFVVHRYDDYVRSNGPGMRRVEDWRLRIEETESEDEYDDKIIGKLTGTWKFADVKHYYNYTDDYGVFYHQRTDNFVKHNPDDPEYSSSLVFNVSADTKIIDTAYQSVKEYVISSDGHLVVASYSDGEIYQRLDYIFHPDNNPSLSFRVSGDILVCDTYTNTYNTDTTKIYFLGSSKIRIESSLKNVFRADSEEWVIELERADGTETPEYDEWIPKLSGDWEPVDYTCLIQDENNSYYYDKFVPYDAVGERYDIYDGSRRSSQTITITPRKEFYWYRVTHDGHVDAEFDLSTWDIVSQSDFFPLPLEASGDILISDFKSSYNYVQDGNFFQHIEVKFIGNDEMKIDIIDHNSPSVYFTHQIKLRRKK